MEMKADNAMEVIFDAKSENESFARHFQFSIFNYFV